MSLSEQAEALIAGSRRASEAGDVVASIALLVAAQERLALAKHLGRAQALLESRQTVEAP